MAVCWKVGSDQSFTGVSADQQCPDGYVYYDGEITYVGEFELAMTWDEALGLPRPWNAQEWKAYAATIKRAEIEREQKIRSETVYGEPISKSFFLWMEEFYSKILLPSARNNITEANSPITWGLKQLRDNGVTLRAQLDAAVANTNVTAQQILDFDVAGWTGWTISRPE